MSDFPNLKQLGITSVDDVIKYTLTRERKLDVLKVYYKRQPNSLLAKSKKFHFERGLNVERHEDKAQHVALQLLHVTEELRTLMANRPLKKKEEIKESIHDRLGSLDDVIESKIYHLKRQLKELE